MGQRIDIGSSSAALDLAGRSGTGEGERGVDLCRRNRAGLRFLLCFGNVASMVGMPPQRRSSEGPGAARQKDGPIACAVFAAGAWQTGLPAAMADFASSEDAWCYVAEKERLVEEAIPPVTPGAKIAFSDYI